MEVYSESIRFECDFSLSKKLRSVMSGNGGKLIIIINDVENGVGNGSVLLSGEKLNLNNAKQLKGSETSIQFTPKDIVDEMPPEHMVQNIFATSDTSSSPPLIKTPVDKIAARHVPEKEDVAYAIKSPEEISQNPPFEEFKNNDFKKFVSNVNELMEEVNKAKNKTSNINLDAIENERDKAIAFEMKEKEEAIEIPAYIVNDSCAFIRINDMDISLGLNMPFDLSKVSAKRIYASNDLKQLLNSNMVKVISPDDVGSYLSKISNEDPYKQGLEVYGDKDSAMDSIEGESDYETYDVTEETQMHTPLNSPEKQKLEGLINLTSNNVRSAKNNVSTNKKGVVRRK